MHQNPFRAWLPLLSILFTGVALGWPAGAQQQACFTAEERSRAEQTAKVYRTPDPGYDPDGYVPDPPGATARDAALRRSSEPGWRCGAALAGSACTRQHNATERASNISVVLTAELRMQPSGGAP
jgi:hypothetical protein